MEEPIKDHDAAVSAINKSKLRYPLRSTTKSKEQNSRGRTASTVSMSLGVLNLSGKDKPDKPPRRLSIPAKSSGSSVSRKGNITPISEATPRRSNNDQRKIEKPASSVSSLASRKKFDTLSSASYWLKQIKLSESAAKHSISLGFFKLAFEVGCEHLPRMRDELKSYARRHNLGDHEALAKEMFEKYNIMENPEQVQVSETCSQVLVEGTRSSDDEVRSTSSTLGTNKLKPRSLNTEPAQVSPVAKSVKKETSPKKNPTPRTRASVNKKPAETKHVMETRVRKPQKKIQKPRKLDSNKDKEPGKNSACDKGPESPSTATHKVQENKENMDDTELDEIEAVET